MCLADVIHYICTLCNHRAGKPRGGRVLEKCPAAPKSEPHCGVLRDLTPAPAADDPALSPSGLEFEVLKVAPGYTLIDSSHRRQKPKFYTCELCVHHLGPDEARVRAKWWRNEQRALVQDNKRLTPGYSMAGWVDVLRK
ncbi:hypothetical protein CTRI78_v008588 [Colletotrichum trifolii]|uniref:Uncharacterized protein n=1 Tax=Colletotrichum trifolii TaxID=5466 RepID=A0A4R8QYZ0_COLTR|nr:hypothetical protein CTRI78_v008588 [Colletotrichum trifolii]